MKYTRLFKALAVTGAATGMGVLPLAANAGQTITEHEGIEKITVTGSRIKRTDLEGASPVAVISAEQISLSGISNVEDLLQEMSFSAGV